jgi:peptide/nickel transport system permease protein
LVQATLDVGYVMLSTAGLSFLGLGAHPPTPEWGATILASLPYQPDAWWYAAFPGLALALTALGFNLVGDGLRDWLDPVLRSFRFDERGGVVTLSGVELGEEARRISAPGVEP